MSKLGLLAHTAAIWLICLIALGICAVSVLDIFQGLMRAYLSDTALIVRLAFSGLIAILAMALFDGARRRRGWSLWPALALVFLIVPTNLYRLGDNMMNPPIPTGGFATAEDVAARESQFLSAILMPTENEFYTQLHRRQVATAFILALVTFPAIALWWMSKRQSLA